jgi:predicted nucleic acid-binding protein
MRAVDTNLLVRMLSRDDPRQAARADRFVETGAWVSHLTLAECIWALKAVYRLDRNRIATAVEMLPRQNPRPWRLSCGLPAWPGRSMQGRNLESWPRQGHRSGP